MSKVVMFDFDGVVADSLDVFQGEFMLACEALGFKGIQSEEAFLKLFEGNLLAQLVKAGFPPWRLKKLFRQLSPRVEAANARVAPFAGMPEALTAIAGQYPTYVITSNVTEAIAGFLVRYGVEGVRDTLGADIEPSKVKKIKQIRRQHPDHTPFYVGDTKGDMLEGREAGATTIGVAWGYHPEATVAEGNPDHIVRTPAELLSLLGVPLA